MITKPMPDNLSLTALLAKSKAAYEAMSLEQKKEMWKTQRESWVIGEMMLEHPEMTREEAKRIYDMVAY